MKSLTLSCLICALNLYFAQKLLEVATSSKNCSKSPKLSKSCRSQSGQAYLSTSKHSRIRIHLHEEKFEFATSRWDRCYFKRDKCVKKTTNKQTNKQNNNNNNNNKNIVACQLRIQTFRWGGGGGGGGGGHPDPEIRRVAVSKNFFFALRASIRGESKPYG